MFTICHYHEIGLKGNNRKFFEEKLIANIKKSLPREDFKYVQRISGRIIVRLTDRGEKRKKKVEEGLRNVFGLASFSFALSCRQEISIIEKEAVKLLKDKSFTTFRIACQRSNKRFSLNSQQVNERIGGAVVKELGKKVNLDNPDVTLFVEIVEDYAFLYLEKTEGLRGLPVSVSGKGIVLISGGIDSPVAAFLAMKRGIKTVFIHFHAHPYTDKSSIKKVKDMVVLLNKYQFESVLYVVPFAEIQQHILLKTKAKLRVILYRRFMFRIAEKIAKREKAKIMITGESVGQVASQTIENIIATGEAVEMPILRPLICYDKEEIIRKARDIGTFDISILPHDDCCVRFLPSHPETKARLEEVKKEEEKLNIKVLIDTAAKMADKILFS